MYIIYNLLLILATIVLSPYMLFKLATVPKYRGGISQKLGRVRKGVLKVLGGTRPIWVHAVSVGEVMAAHPLIRELRKRYPGRKLILSTVTVTGNFTAKKRVPEADAVFYFPFDYPWVVRRVIRIINPANGRKVIAVVLDGGPACSAEQKIQKAMLDTSAPVFNYLFDSGKTWTTKSSVHVIEVDNSTALGIEK